MSDSHGTFCTVVNCMDGRTQLPVNEFLRRRFGADFVDTVTEPGPNHLLAERSAPSVASILHRVGISVHKHGSRGIAVVGHHDCAGNPADEPTQRGHLAAAVPVLAEHFPDVEIIALWVDADWQVHELRPATT